MERLKTIPPTRIFLIDALGALTSTVLLTVVLVYFQAYIGLPIPTLYLLGALAGVFFIYSFSSFLWAKDNWRFWMRGIAIVNFSYCILTLILCFWHYPLLKPLGWAYFIGESGIVLSLAWVEWRRARID